MQLGAEHIDLLHQRIVPCPDPHRDPTGGAAAVGGVAVVSEHARTRHPGPRGTGQNFGTVCVTLPNGQIASHVMWVDADDEHIIFNTEVHRAKFRALEANPQVTMTVWKADNPYAYAEVRGHVAETSPVMRPAPTSTRCPQRYTGSEYSNPITSERVIVKVAPDPPAGARTCDGRERCVRRL